MKVKNKLRKMLKEYRSIFKSKADCYSQLFCTIGNGYHWKNGELISVYKDKQSKHSLETENVIYRSALLMLEDDPDNVYYKQVIEDYGPDELSKETIDSRVQDTHLKQGRDWYPLSEEYSYIYHIPKDIKPDWLEAARETLQLLIRDGVKVNKKKLDKRLL